MTRTARASEPAVAGRLVEDDDGAWYRIDGVEQMEPFLLTVVSAADLWMFLSSTGTLTAGRRDADGALLPYETDDRLHRAVGRTGPVTVLSRGAGEDRQLWRPFSADLSPGCTRWLAKRTVGDAVVLAETNHLWGIEFRQRWEPAPNLGWVRTSELVDLSDDLSDDRCGSDVSVEVLDGLLDVMPSGVDAVTEQLTSNLVDAYKRSEVGRWGRLAVFALESLITDRAEPAESLEATVVWSLGLPGADVHLDERVLADVLADVARPPADVLTGRRGSYLLHGEATVPAGGSTSWTLVADVRVGTARAHDTVALAASAQAPALVARDVAGGRARLESLLAQADSWQRTGDPVADAHHLSNVLFNSMRGGVFPYGYRVRVEDLLAFLAVRNADVHARHGRTIRALGEWVELLELRAFADASVDPDLVRLVLEYLPLTFSRRHGDPSRPWNRFEIRVTDDAGDELLAYEGNWRDIFQNWEALLRSFPRYHANVVATFVDASTLDGHNPYRISRDGIDWEVPDPDDPWSNIGYWGDHQIVYLLRLLEGWRAVEPDGLADWLERPVFTYADVPYRIVDHGRMVADPRDTIEFEPGRQAEVDRRVARLGGDGRLVVDTAGELVRVTLLEKLLVPALAKLSSLVAGGGIWLNTQRPEWNDANNALAGYGLSVVTLHHLERYLAFLAEVVDLLPGDDVALSATVATWLGGVTRVLEGHDPREAVRDARARRRLLDDLARVADAHRARVADGVGPSVARVAVDTVRSLLVVARRHVGASVVAAVREDGLVHSYDLVSFPDGERAEVAHLGPMLEGQVAALTAPSTGPQRAVAIVDALFSSRLYRPDQRSFVLYPAARPPAFLDRNTIPADLVAAHPVLERLVGAGRGAVLQRDGDGGLHVRAGLSNAVALEEALQRTDLDDDERAEVHGVYEQVFQHHAFTGRSSGMYGYEGLGSVYWHMVSKLLLAVQEQHRDAVVSGEGQEVVARLAQAYRRVRDGLGFRKDPGTFGAVPTDCYSHTPAHAGAQQPGMTGQVKEAILARLAELGLHLRDGGLELLEPLLPAQELFPAGERAYGCTVCGVPVRVVAADRDVVRVEHADGSVDERPGSRLDREACAALFGRTGEVVAVELQSTRWAGDPGPVA
jgi:hypothetical protein